MQTLRVATLTVLAVVLVLGTAAWADGQIRMQEGMELKAVPRPGAWWVGLTMEERIERMERKARVIRQLPGAPAFDPIAAAAALDDGMMMVPMDYTGPSPSPNLDHVDDPPGMFPDLEGKCPDGWALDGARQICFPESECMWRDTPDCAEAEARASKDH